jgi:prepilin-type N-terminal cleavage/methylation domain-containing protein
LCYLIIKPNSALSYDQQLRSKLTLKGDSMYVRKRHQQANGILAFTLVELLVAIFIVSILAAILLPALINAMNLAKQVSCGSQMRQTYFFFSCYADENGGRLPEGNNPNPLLMTKSTALLVEEYLASSGGTADILYCPALPDYSRKTHWLQFSANACRIGYTYFGGISNPNWKFQKPIPTKISDRMSFLVDTCNCPRYGAHSSTQAIEVGEWDIWPHYGIDKPIGGNQLFNDGSVRFIPIFEMTHGYRFLSPGNLYW